MPGLRNVERPGLRQDLARAKIYQIRFGASFFTLHAHGVSSGLKEVEAGRTPEQVVGNIAAKTPETGSVVSVDHWHLRLADLDGYQIEIERPPYVHCGVRGRWRKTRNSGRPGDDYFATTVCRRS